jgi:hypothetical protein
MELVCESDQLEDYLLELKEVNYSNPIIKGKIEELFNPTQTEIDYFGLWCYKFSSIILV